MEVGFFSYKIRRRSDTIQHYPTTEVLDTRQVQAIELLAQNMPKANVAKKLGINRSTIYEWLGQPAFEQTLQTRKAQIRAIIQESSPYVAGLLHWNERLPEVMQSVLEVACDPTHRNHLRAAELVFQRLKPECVEESVTQDARVIAEYAQTHGWYDDGTA